MGTFTPFKASSVTLTGPGKTAGTLMNRLFKPLVTLALVAAASSAVAKKTNNHRFM